MMILPAAQIIAGKDRTSRTSRSIHFTPYKLRAAIGPAAGDRRCHLHKGSIARPHSTVPCAAIHYGEHWDRQQLSWEKPTAHSGRRQTIELVLSESCKRVIDRCVVLAIDRASLALLCGIARWFCCAARKHAGRRRDGLRFAFRYPHAKRVSSARFSDFALDIRRIIVGVLLRGYAFDRDGDDRALIIMRPTPSAGRAGKLPIPPADVETSGVAEIGIPRASTSLLPGQASQPIWSHPESGSRQNWEPESSFVTVEQSSSGRRPGHGAAHHWGRAL